MELIENFDIKKIEKIVKDDLKEKDIHRLIQDDESKNNEIIFIEGPPTMNGIPHAGHLRGRVFKDLWYRYNVLSGNKVIFNAGWDTQGLPVELQAEKELGIENGKSDITSFEDIERLVSECKNLVKKYHAKWVEVDELIGMSFNQDNAYWTYKDEFIEKEWQLMKKAFENGVLTEGFRVVAYCPSCQTSLSHSEVNQGYDMVKDPSLYYKVKLEKEEKFLIVWTTMPFTLVTDAMVGVNPKEEYVEVLVDGETWIVGKTRLEDFMIEVKIGDYKVQKTFFGTELEGKKYIHPLLDEIPKLAEIAKQDNYHVTVAEDFVDVNAGSGLVHLSPANGEEDNNIAMKRNVTIFCPIDDQVKFTEDAGKYAGLFVRDADEKLVQSVKDRNALVRIGKIKHKYPLCWRCNHGLIWLARREYFYMLDKLGDKAINAAEDVEYFFEQPKNRFLEIIKEKHPWCISRERFWGCPIPIWKCNDCGNMERLFSRKEIVESAIELPDGENFELHRPWIDKIKVKCTKCDAVIQREEFVLDTWHNSGAAPIASLDENTYKGKIPAPFFTEGIDQTRGWAYTLLIENVIYNNSPISPYKSFLFQGHVLDENGNKMSKSKGNVLEAKELLEKYPVDLVRFYFMWKSSPIEPLNFSTKELMSRPYQVISTLYHLHTFYKQNSEYDKFELSESTIEWAKENDLLTPPDVWLLSKLQRMIERTTDANDTCRFHESAKAIEDFLINSLSQIYIPITKSELWDEDDSKKDRRFTIYAILAKTLKTIDILIHPFTPFTSQYLYETIFNNKDNILLESWPKVDSSLIDEKVETSFDLLKETVSITSAARMKGKLKRRWPLNQALICVNKGEKQVLESLSELVKSQMNVQNYEIFEVEHMDGIEQYLELKQNGLPVVPTIELERSAIGPKAKQDMGKLLQMFSDTEPETIINELKEKNTYTFQIDGNSIILDKEDFIVDFAVNEKYQFAKRQNLIVIISLERDDEMMAKGLIKDLARRIQTLRKEKGYNPTDILERASILDLDQDSLNLIKDKTEDIAFLVRVKNVDFTESCKNYKEDDIDGLKIKIAVE